MGLNMGLPQQTWIKKTFIEWKKHWLPGKEKIAGEAVSKGHATNLFDHEGTYHFWFP